MTDRKRDLRRKTPITYLISDDSEGEQSPSEVSSAFSTPRKPRRSNASLEFEEELESKPVKTPPPRFSAAGHSLRQHQHLHLSLRAQENGDKQTLKRRGRRKISVREKDGVPDVKHESTQRSARYEIRDAIATGTLVKRRNYFLAKKDYFLPLLPANNHITRLAEARKAELNGEDEDLSIPYEAIEQQPQGYGYPLC